MMYDPFRGYDQWLTTDRSLDRDELPPQPKCAHCGRFVKTQPDFCEDKADILHCDGTAKEMKVYYSDHHLEVNRLWGAGDSKFYTQTVSDCGVDTTPHAPHDEVQWAWTEQHRICASCGYDTITVDA